MAKIVSKTSKFLIKMIYFLRIRPWMCIRYQQFSTSIIISSLITTNITANQEPADFLFSGFIDIMKSSEMY